jgi:glycosyltransferase involved in cell wall biosynthesis
MNVPAARRRRVFMIGFRGFPGVQGGVETHVQNLCPLLVQEGWDVEAAVRAPYVAREAPRTWQGVSMVRIWTPRSRSLEAIVHTTLAVLRAIVTRPDIVHIQAIGPALLTPLARLFGLRVVVTHHGPDYDRQKWGRVARWTLVRGESAGMRRANARIAISRSIRQLVATRYGVDCALIPNGVTERPLPLGTGALERFGLERGRYVLLVSRLVAEKRHLDLLAAFRAADLVGWKLVLVGGADHRDAYVEELERVVAGTDRVVMTGFQTGDALAELYANAGVFVLPSSHEGLPIAMLEALGYGLQVVASDIPANLEVGLPAEHYFPLGDVPQLGDRLRRFAQRPLSAEQSAAARNWVFERYSWPGIARLTADVYRKALET